LSQVRQRQSAVRWFLDSVAKPDEAEKHAMFRIYNLEVLQTLGLERRQGFRYALGEIRAQPEKLQEFDKQVREASGLDAEKMSFCQRKLLEVSERFHNYMRLTNAFQPLDLPAFPNEKDLQADRQGALNTWIRRVMEASSLAEREMQRTQAPLAVPAATEDLAHGENVQPWQAYATAYNRSLLRKQVLGQDADPAVAAWGAMFDAYRRGDAKTFNAEVAKYQQHLKANPPAEYSARKASFEAYYNHVAPFRQCIALYLIGSLLAAAAWLGWSRTLNRAAFWLLVLAFSVHTLALLARIYISGRPPVTNLYSSAVFIAWSIVLAGLILEAVFRFGLGNVVAAVGGFKALLIAAYLGMNGDTFTVMQAVLDTQFWLATHVVCIAIGYAATFVAGLLGIFYIAAGLLTYIGTHQLSHSGTADLAKTLTRAIYGVIAFATIFSLIGTVLGGLWADDSWGRFWGWDPKENGALMIVLWNALVLHARWGGMVRDRGLAVLAVGGNIMTSWSWFGVNELGVGLHSYGFTEGVLLALGLFVASQMVVIGAGCLPAEIWRRFRDTGDDDPLVTAEIVS
jgi:ABC-type transport system involved in cytochrome c biogenesis permease subunit